MSAHILPTCLLKNVKKIYPEIAALYQLILTSKLIWHVNFIFANAPSQAMFFYLGIAVPI